MKLSLPLITAGVGICLSALAQTTPDKTWRFGPYDKRIAPKPSDIATPPPPPALRGAIVPSKTATNAPATPRRKEKK